MEGLSKAEQEVAITTGALLIQLRAEPYSQRLALNTGAACCSWMRDAGFRETYVQHLVTLDSMVVGIK
jgi:hypothetical protein